MPTASHTARITSADDLVPLLDKLSAQLAWTAKARYQIELALDELIGNTLTHGKPPNYGGIQPAVFIDVCFEQVDVIVKITLTDNGIAFDPTSAVAPDVTSGAEDRKIGGLGLYFAAKMMDTISYQFSGGRNHVVLCKQLS